nr:SpoIIE family protein phosphatase [Ornithinimicrobium cavernae]
MPGGDERFSHKAAVRAGVLRFYAGQPLDVNGERVGALCIADDSPRELSEEQVALLGDLAHLVEVELSRTRELWQAAEVQRRLLPATSPDLPGFDVAGRCVQARVVGGDFFDWHVTDGHLQLVIADVMGKGLSAAILAASVRATLRVATRFNPLDVAVTKAAASIADDFEDPGTFVTAFLVSLDYRTGRLEYIDAGHGLAIIIDASGEARRLIGEYPPFGIDLGHAWHTQEGVLEPGETLIAVSDGFMDFFDDPWDSIGAAAEVTAKATSASGLVDDFID